MSGWVSEEEGTRDEAGGEGGRGDVDMLSALGWTPSGINWRGGG